MRSVESMLLTFLLTSAVSAVRLAPPSSRLSVLPRRARASIVALAADASLAEAVDSACARAAPPRVGLDDNGETELRIQNELLSAYAALASQGRLRAFGSCAGALPAPEPRELPPEAQFQLTGLPTKAFAPPPVNNVADLAVGLTGAGLLAAAALVLQVDYRLFAGGIGAALAADRILFKGLLAEGLTRAVRPGYASTVVKHEAGHLLVAVLLGCPIQNVVLDPIAALRDGRFGGVAGTVFFDPALGEGMRNGRLSRESIDRFSVIVMAGLAAEAMLNGKALGGQSDEQSLVALLASLDGGRTWNLGRIQNQARWGASQALLLLREHRPVYDALVTALESGCTVGEAIATIEAAVVPTFGRNGELPGETRRRKLRSAAAELSDLVAPARVVPQNGDAAAAAVSQIAERLRAIDRRLAELDPE